MSHLPIPSAVLYAGLAGSVLAVIVASASHRWSLRVFFLVALRLAIGWHFLFEGLYKIQSYYTGPTETSKPFSSEPYFRAAPGPLGQEMRKQFSDSAAEIAAKVRAAENISVAEFEKLSVAEQAAKCPEAVARLIDADHRSAMDPSHVAPMLEWVKQAIKMEIENAPKTIKTAEEKAAREANEAESAALARAAETEGGQVTRWTKEDLAEIKKDAEKARTKAKLDADRARKEFESRGEQIDTLAAERILAAKAAYARWVYGVDPRPTQVKSVSGDVMLTAPQRLAHLEWVKNEARAAEELATDGLGNGTGTESKRLAEFRIGAIAAETELVRDANSFILELQKDLAGGQMLVEASEPLESTGQRLDRFTMWFLVAVGGCLMAGFFTRIACLAATGFLAMTYLTHPAFPWFPQPPNTEGNPLFINKNVIEGLALLALACYPTGRWLGLDAIVLRPFCKHKAEGRAD
jgi:uncharacterized membrane protein YphA (DoxX/SURF4 family)